MGVSGSVSREEVLQQDTHAQQDVYDTLSYDGPSALSPHVYGHTHTRTRTHKHAYSQTTAAAEITYTKDAATAPCEDTCQWRATAATIIQRSWRRRRAPGHIALEAEQSFADYWNSCWEKKAALRGQLAENLGVDSNAIKVDVSALYDRPGFVLHVQPGGTSSLAGDTVDPLREALGV
jgi:hypothetical protein